MSKYRDFNYQPAKSYSRNSGGKIRWRTGLGFVITSVIILFGLKLLLTPVMSALAGFWQDSAATLSYFVGQKNIRQDNGVTNFLLVGLDQRYEGGTTLTDTIILASYRQADEKMTLISFPRDLWVRVPRFNGTPEHYSKINAIYSLGEKRKYQGEENNFGGGIGLLADVLTTYIQVPIHYYAVVNFNAFRGAVDAVDGIDVYVERSFTDYRYPKEGYEDAPWDSRWEVVSFEKGWRHLDGEQALKFARSRHALGAEGSDFARAKRQQKVLLALKEKVLSSETLFNLDSLRNLYVTLDREVKTNIALVDIPLFYELTKQIEDFSKVSTYVLTAGGDGEADLLYQPNPEKFGGAYILLPREGWGAVREFVKEILLL